MRANFLKELPEIDCSLVEDLDSELALAVMDGEGELCFHIPEALNQLPPAQFEIAVCDFYRSWWLAGDNAYHRGFRAGQAQVRNTVQELLGVDKLVEAIRG